MPLDTVRFTTMDDTTAEDWDLIIRQHEAYHTPRIADRVIGLLHDLRGPKLGFQIDRFDHSLQTASRALRAGADEETVVVALLHDIGDNLAPENHCEIAAGILQPYVGEENYWLVRNHVTFTGYYFFHLTGGDRNAHLKLRGHPAYEKTNRFVREWDGPSFDPEYPNLPFPVFEPMVRRIFARRPNSHWRPTEEARSA
jgi:predicted HD phosphohydrolase